MPERHLVKLDPAILSRYKCLRIRALNNRRSGLQHVDKVLQINLPLLHSSNKRSHVEQGPRQLHEVGLEEDEITGSHGADGNGMCCHEQINGETRGVDHSLAGIQRRKGVLDVHGVLPDRLNQLSIAIAL